MAQLHTKDPGIGLQIESSEARRVATLLGMAAGFLEAYTYLERGGVFANAQTGNMALLGVYLIQGHWREVINYLVPLLAFVLGIFLTRLLRYISEHRAANLLHWRQWVLGLELVFLWSVGFIPVGEGWNRLATLWVSFVCALQLEAFRKVHGQTFATTMCTGNLRSGVELVCLFWKTGNWEHLNGAMNYFSVIGSFVLGAAVSGMVCPLLSERAVWVACLPLSIAFGWLFIGAVDSSEVYTTGKHSYSSKT